MPHTFASLRVHVVFSTQNRAPDLSAELPGRLFPYMGGWQAGYGAFTVSASPEDVRNYIAAQ